LSGKSADYCFFYTKNGKKTGSGDPGRVIIERGVIIPVRERESPFRASLTLPGSPFVSFFSMMGKKDRIASSVKKFGMPSDHVKDLRYTCLMTRNNIIQWLRKSGIDKFSIIDNILNTSKVIEETTLTRVKLVHLEEYYKTELIRFYLKEGADHGCTYKIPNKTDTFKMFGRKTDFIKDVAMTMVLEMYELDQINRREMTVELHPQHTKNLDLVDLYDRVSENLNKIQGDPK
jgi:hypothetical protein